MGWDEAFEAAGHFAFEGKVSGCAPYGNGHINETWLAELTGGEKVILQKISSLLTKDVDGLMDNISGVTAHLCRKEPDPRKVLRLIGTKEGKACWHSPSGAWRAFAYIEDSICLEKAGCDEDLRQSALAFGGFTEMLRDFPAHMLRDVIPDFHNTPVRMRQLHLAAKEDRAGRKKEVGQELHFLLERETEMGRLWQMKEKGDLPVRVTHNDTKLNNVLFDRASRTALCVIDLDTVMPGLIPYDFGDAVRYGAATSAEDERDADRMKLDLHRYQVYLEGFLEACPGLTTQEVEALPLGAKTITLEQAARFLTDYLNGDMYYRISRPGQNLDRCRTQIRLAEDMEKKWKEMGRGY